MATLPDGSPMVLEVLPDSSDHWNGDFVVAAETGIYAFQEGVFEGSVKGSSVEATCELEDGAEFQLTGKMNRDGSLDLIRSDISGQTLHFVRQAASPHPSRANISFNLTTGPMSGVATISDQPDFNSGGVKGYSGTWNDAFLRVWLYDSGPANLNVHPDNRSSAMSSRFSFRLSNFASTTVTVDNEITYDRATPSKRFSFKGSFRISPR
ncbi:hypothetical protein OP10G_1193 [Fimbriimonas ginsengisoli Gsoil 348]|uniref:Uncharacterized protein n=1 Tax=Fimbriimonas ginsengisoli Gsoil 348 TaxID=661478 RepID=A0A068NM98_FIMGI|nr:hypothetical protein OP10G_1193 [Fimbriimonas ginsengisoli Gsoil 348]